MAKEADKQSESQIKEGAAQVKPKEASAFEHKFPKTDIPKEKQAENQKEIKETQEETYMEGEIVEPSKKPATEEDEHLPETKSFTEKINELLSELNINPTHIRMCAGCLIIIAILVTGGIYGFDYFKGSGKETAKEKPKTEETAVKAPAKKQVLLDDSVKSSLIFGKTYFFPASYFTSSDIELALIAGRGVEQKDMVSQALLLLKQMQNAYSTNINESLNQNVDRRSVLRNHIAYLEKLHREGGARQGFIIQEFERLSLLLKEAETKQASFEQGFFAETKNLNPEAGELLKNFVVQAEETVLLKAYVAGFQNIGNFYKQALPRLEARIKDLKLNEEALVMGVKVFDVSGSDLELIIREEGVSGTSEPKQGVTKFMPKTSPSQKDFITKPTL